MMKTKFFLAAGLLVTAFGFAQNTTYYPVPSGGTYPTGAAGTVGVNCVHIGNGAGASATADAKLNVFIGNDAGRDHVGLFEDEDANVFIGAAAGRDNIYGKKNVYVGRSAGLSNENGDFNVFLGNSSGQFNQGQSNVFVGQSAGYNNINGIGNVFIGANSGENNTGNYQLHIDNSNTNNPLIYGVFETVNSDSQLKFNARKVGIGFEGTTDPGFGDFPNNTLVNYDDYRLFVRGGILAEEVRIRTQANWADYVFADDYKLMPLNEVEQYINDNGHLPNMPSAEEVEKEGLALGNIVKLQQEKIEELTLHLIEQEKEIEQLKAKNKEIDELKAQVQLLLNKQ